MYISSNRCDKYTLGGSRGRGATPTDYGWGVGGGEGYSPFSPPCRRHCSQCPLLYVIIVTAEMVTSPLRIIYNFNVWTRSNGVQLVQQVQGSTRAERSVGERRVPSLRAADAVGGTSVSIAAAVAHTTFLYAYLRIHSLLTFISALFLFERTMQDTFRNRSSI